MWFVVKSRESCAEPKEAQNQSEPRRQSIQAQRNKSKPDEAATDMDTAADSYPPSHQNKSDKAGNGFHDSSDSIEIIRFRGELQGQGALCVVALDTLVQEPGGCGLTS